MFLNCVAAGFVERVDFVEIFADLLGIKWEEGNVGDHGKGLVYFLCSATKTKLD